MLMDHRSRALCALAVAGALVGFTGCSGSDKKSSSSNTATTPAPATDTTASGGSSGGGSVADYKTGAQKAANDFKNSAQAASQKVSVATTTADKIAGLEALKASVSTAADDFAALNPPANIKTDNAELVTEFRTLAGNVDTVEQALKTNDKAKAQSALPQLTQNQTKIATTIARIQSKIGG
jgi:hypothetical protein